MVHGPFQILFSVYDNWRNSSLIHKRTVLKKITYLVSLGLVLFSSTVSSQSNDPHKLNILANDSFGSFSWLDTLISSKRMLLYGEDHRYLKSNRDLELKTLRYIQSKKPVTYITEFGPVSNWLLEKFVNENDTVVERFFNTQYFPSYGKFYTDLRTSTKEGHRVSFEGIDVQRQVNESVFAFSYVLPLRDKMPDSLVLILESLHGLHELFNQRGVQMRTKTFYSNLEETPDTTEVGYFYPLIDEDVLDYRNTENINTYATFVLLFSEMQRRQDELYAYAGKDSAEFRFFMEETERMLYWNHLGRNNNLMASIYRERIMYANMERLFREDTTAFFFGMFGRCHTGKSDLAFECGVYKFRSFVSRLSLQTGTNLADEIVSVAVFYPNNTGGNDLSINSPADSLFDAAPEHSISLYYLGKREEATILNERFDWVIFNKKSSLTSNSYYTYVERGKEGKDGFTYPSWKSIFQLGFGAKTIHTKTFTDNKLKINPYLYNIHASIYENEEGYTTFGASFDYFWSPTRNRISDSSSLNFNGLKLQFFMGADLLDHNRWDIILAGGIGYSRMQMLYELNEVQTVNRFLPTHSSEAYIKQAFALDGILRINYLYHDFTFGMVGGYSLDASGRKWKYNGTKFDSPLKANTGGLYLNAVIGFWIW
jgi:hypothetical protein